MTSTEILIKNLCDDRRRQIAAQPKIKIREYVPVREVRGDVRRALYKLLKLRPLVSQAESVLRLAGFEVPNGGDPYRLQVAYTLRRGLEEDESRKRAKQFEEIDRLRHRAQADVLGFSIKTHAAHIQKVIRRLEEQLAAL